MSEHILRRFLEHPSRRWIVVTLTFVIGLVTVWPAADEYITLTTRRADLEKSVSRTKKSLSRLEFFEKRVGLKVEELDQREAEAISQVAAREFRSRVVDLARDHGCQVRRVNLSEAKSRKWREKDSPLEKVSRVVNGKETKFELRTQQFKMTVVGPIAAIIGLLTELRTDGKLIYTHVFSIRPTAQDRNTAEAEIELMLFDLEGDPAVSA